MQANACQPEPTRRAEARKNAENLARERQLAIETSRTADLIAIGEVKSVERTSEIQRKIFVEISQTLKGERTSSASFAWENSNYVVITCIASDMFNTVNVRPSNTYLFYVKDGAVLRAGQIDRFPFSGSLSLQDELRIVESTNGT